jgi:ABC-type polysaccharide/polyol phosphate export permease
MTLEQQRGVEASAGAVAVPGRDGRDDFGEWHVYEPHKVGLPPLGPYFRALWKRRQFIFELARTNLRADHFNTTFGQLWLVLNPIFMGLIYFMLVTIIHNGGKGSAFLAHLMICLFSFRMVSGTVSSGARSVVGGGKLILNTAFPRLLLPLECVLESVLQFIPTLMVFSVIFVIVGLPFGAHLLWVIPIFIELVVFGAGAAMIVATMQVYFRDLANFLPYFTRIWLYTSPILFTIDEVPARLKPILVLNPMYPMLGALNDVVIDGINPPLNFIAWGFGWAFASLFFGTLFFISREREFAIRL